MKIKANKQNNNFSALIFHSHPDIVFIISVLSCFSFWSCIHNNTFSTTLSCIMFWQGTFSQHYKPQHEISLALTCTHFEQNDFCILLLLCCCCFFCCCLLIFQQSQYATHHLAEIIYKDRFEKKGREKNSDQANV